MKIPVQRLDVAALGLALLLLAGIAVYGFFSTARLASDGADLARTQRVLALLATLQANAVEAEASQRGFALTGDASYLEPFTRAKEGANARLADLRAVDASSAERYERLVALGALLARRFDGLGAAIEARSRGGAAAALHWEATGEGRRADERLRGVLQELQRHAETERQAIQRRSESSARLAQGAVIACGLAALGIAGLALLRLQSVGQALGRALEQRVGATDGHRRADDGWQRLFELAPDVVCELDAEGRFTRISAGSEKLWGWSADELIGKPASDKAVTEDQPKTGLALAALASNPGTQTLRNRWRRKDGAVVHLQWAAQGASEGRNALCVARDVTELERLRLAVPRQTQAMAAAGTELKQAVVRADAAQSLQALFVSTVGQALREPAQAILARSAPVPPDRQPPLDPGQRQQWAQVHEQADALCEAIDDVLDCGAVEAGQLALKKEAFDVWELLNQAAATARPRAERKGLAFRLQLPDDLGYAHGDTRRVEQLVHRLLHTAIAATDAGEVVLAAARQLTGTVRIEVHDSALVPGDPAELFTPPDAAGSPPGAPRPAASVGLILSQRLTRLMGGELEARKAPSQGRVFTLTLPADHMGAAA